MMMPVAVVVAGSMPPGAADVAPLALLRPVTDGPAMVVAVRDTAAGRILAIDCIDRCPKPPFAEAFPDTPLGLFQPFDREPVVVAVAAAGSAYRVRAYRLTAGAVTRVLDVASRAAPAFAVAADGAITVTTSERRSDRAAAGSDRRVTWTCTVGASSAGLSGADPRQ